MSAKRRLAALFVSLAIVMLPIAIVLVHRAPASAYPCPCNIFGTPSGQSDFDDGSDVELGFKFKSEISGYITGVRFYKQGAMSGTHTGRLWQTDGTPMASAVFTETASGWQDVTFSSPVAVTANTLYVASVTMSDGRYIATPNYYATDHTVYPLTAPSSTNAGGNGVYTPNAGNFPDNISGNFANYWIDVDFKATNTPTPPTVASVLPVASSTDVLPGETIKATFNMSMNPDSVTSSSFIVKDDQGSTLDSTASYDNASMTASLVADDGFVAGKVYTATLKSGASGVQNIDGTPMASDYSWSFTIVSSNACPCSVKDRAAPKGAVSADDLSGTELGIKLAPQTNGYISAVRFYKPITSTLSSHDVHIWGTTGSVLATAVSSNESDYGWQEVKLSSPLRVDEGKVYIVSFSSPDGVYMASQHGVDNDLGNSYIKAYANGDSRNAATGSGNGNGVFSATSGGYPNSAFNASYYWVDAVFTTSPTDTWPVTVDSAQPSDGSYGVVRPAVLTAKLDRAANPLTVSTATVHVTDASGTAVAGNVTYDAANYMIKFTPSSTLAYGKKYTVTLDGSIADNKGVTMSGDYTWSFTTGSQLATDPNQGPGGPILVITASGDSYGKYYAEILRTEGLNYFDVKDIASVSASTLSSYDAVVLGETSLTQPQADMFSAWVNAGGNLVAMRPDIKLASLLGLTSTGASLSNAYMLVDTATAPGKGIVGQTIQYKGTADKYSLSGANQVAALYSDAGSSTDNPAVTYRNVGSKGGTAAAFTFDLAKSIIALHQGNKAWAGQDRDGDGTMRSNDLFFGARTGDVQPDYVDLNKVNIPQADEQQRLLANVIIEATKDVQPMPRFWYLPHDYKAAVVMAGDDHGLTESVGIRTTYNNFLNSSPTDCSMIDWQCVRSSGYIYENSGITPAHALQFSNLGFEVADHVPGAGHGCTNYTSLANLNSLYDDSLAAYKVNYGNLPDQRTTRFHCYDESDWDSQPKAELAHGMRYDLNYTTYPASWIGTKAAIVTGSAMNMRFTDVSGAMIDVYQGVTNFENTTSPASTINAVLSSATGADGYYGIFGTHYDMSGDSYDKTVFTNVDSHSVPMISSDQALTWLDGHGSSKFGNFSGSNGKFSFDITAAEGAVGLRAMMPTNDAGGIISSIKQGSSTVSYQTQQVKGVSYAVFDAAPGSYTITYSDYVSGSNDGGSTNDTGSGTGGSSSSNSSVKKTSRNSGGTSQDTANKQSGSSNEVSAATPETPNPSAGTGAEDDDDGKTIVQQASSKGSSLGKWLVGIGLVIFGGGIFAGAVYARRRHSVNW